MLAAISLIMGNTQFNYAYDAYDAERRYHAGPEHFTVVVGGKSYVITVNCDDEVTTIYANGKKCSDQRVLSAAWSELRGAFE